MTVKERPNGNLVADFGFGTVRICRAGRKEEGSERVVVLTNWNDGETPRNTGEIFPNDPMIGMEVDRLPDPKIILDFANLKGVDALLAELQLLKDHWKD